jgi:acetyl esterase/lipase
MDPEVERFAANAPKLDLRDLQRSRGLMEELFRALGPGAPAPPEKGFVTHGELYVEDVTCNGVACYLYRPATVPSETAAVLLMHGGGFALGGRFSAHEWSLQVCAALGVVVLNPEYRLAPEEPFPAALEDCYSVLSWMSEHATQLRIDTARIAVGGTSAGANLAAAVSVLARDRGGPHIAFQLLVCPVLDDRMSTASMAEFTDTLLWNRAQCEEMWALYLPANPRLERQYASPARVENLRHLPPAYIRTAGLDPLRDEGIDYAKALMAAGVPVELHNTPGVPHSYQTFPAGLSRKAQQEHLEALAAALGTPIGAAFLPQERT